MKKVLIITRHYLNENSGGPNCSKAYIGALSFLYDDCSIVYPEHSGMETDFSFASSKIKLFPCYDNRGKIKKGLDVYSGILHRFSVFVPRLLKEQHYDLVFLDHSVTAAKLIKDIKKVGAQIVTIHHNVEKIYVKDNLPSILYRLPYVYYTTKAERDALLVSDLNITLTKKDADTFVKGFNIQNVENVGLFEYKSTSNEKPEEIIGDGNFAISGSLGYKQSESAILEFLKLYFPILRKVCPKSHLMITGRNPSERLVRACEETDGVILIPNPANVRDIIKKVSYYVCPLNMGSGVKLRIMDGLKLGLPVIAHTVSVNGYESIEKGGCLFGYSDSETFERSLQKISLSSFSRIYIYETYQSYFSFESGLTRLRKVLDDKELL